MTSSTPREPAAPAARATLGLSPTTETHVLRSAPIQPGITLTAAVLGFFLVTLDAVIVNVALPSIGNELGGGMSALPWVVNAYTLAFAALLIPAGAWADRVGASRAFMAGVGGFVIFSLCCGLAPGMPAMIVFRCLQGMSAACMMPSSMALVGQAYPDPSRRVRAVAVWALGGGVAASAAPVLGGALTLLSWRWIFFINVPVGAVALALLLRTAPSPRRVGATFDPWSQLLVVLATLALTFGAVEAGSSSPSDPRSLACWGVAAVAIVAFGAVQRRAEHPMIPPPMLRSGNFLVSLAVGFAFVVAYYGLPFVMTLFLQQGRGYSAWTTGLVFVPMMVAGLVLTPVGPVAVRWVGARWTVIGGLVLIGTGLGILAAVPVAAPLWVVAGLMLLVGAGAPFVMPPTMSVLLGSVPEDLAGTASGVLHTSRQVGGALAVATFGALLADPRRFEQGMRQSLAIATVVILVAVVAASRFTTSAHDE